MDIIAVEAEYMAFNKTYLSSNQSRSDRGKLGGQISGLRRRELMRERLPLLKEIFDSCGITATLNVCKRADEKIFKMSSNFKEYSEYFPSLKGSKRTASDKILSIEIIKISDKAAYQKQQRKFKKEKEKIEDFFNLLRRRNSVGESIKIQDRIKQGGRGVGIDIQLDVIKKNPEMLLFRS